MNSAASSVGGAAVPSMYAGVHHPTTAVSTLAGPTSTAATHAPAPTYTSHPGTAAVAAAPTYANHSPVASVAAPAYTAQQVATQGVASQGLATPSGYFEDSAEYQVAESSLGVTYFQITDELESTMPKGDIKSKSDLSASMATTYNLVSSHGMQKPHHPVTFTVRSFRFALFCLNSLTCLFRLDHRPERHHMPLERSPGNDPVHCGPSCKCGMGR
jgi:hypothetical protein